METTKQEASTMSTMSGRDFDAATLLRQIGRGNVLAISGGRVVRSPTGAVILPVSNGYSVQIDLAADDTYTVRRVFRRGLKSWSKGEVSGVHCEDVGEAAYQASCFRNGPWGGQAA